MVHIKQLVEKLENNKDYSVIHASILWNGRNIRFGHTINKWLLDYIKDNLPKKGYEIIKEPSNYNISIRKITNE